MTPLPLLSICMITYGHEQFIYQAIEGVLLQKTNFEYEVIIANDCSPDDTLNVINDIIANHPKGNCIKLFNHTENKGMYENFVFALGQCQGRYIALCEGDDYWTDPFKLQKQVDFLETHPEYEVCFTNIKVIGADDSIKKEKLIPDGRKDTYESKDLPIWAPTLTRVFKNRDFNNIPNAPGLDTVMLLWQSQYGKIKFINEVTGVYRMHHGGIYSSKPDAKRKEHMLLTMIASLELIDRSILNRYFGMLFKKLLEIYYLDNSLFPINKNHVKEAYKKYTRNMPLILKIKISFAFSLVSFIKIGNSQLEKKMKLKILNHLFIY